MECKRLEKRTIFNMFEIYNCVNCINDYIYEYIYIGNNIINIYKINNKCINYLKQYKTKLLYLKENIINNQDIFLIINHTEYYKIFDILPLLLENNNLYILLE